MAMCVSISLFVLYFAISLLSLKTEAAKSFTIDYENDTFLKDGQPFRYISGSMHYSRIPSFYWRDRLEKMAAAGLNAVQTYVPWNFHETDRGIVDFDGDKDIVKFIQTAKDVGLLVILRAGPYICAEWDMGGLPAWLLTNRSMVLRSSDPSYLMYVDLWFSVLLPMMKPLLYENGGPIITVQVENEYGSYFTCDQVYLSHLHDTFRKYLGNTVVLFTTDGASPSLLKCGTNTKLFYATVDFGITSNPSQNFQAQRTAEPHGPLVNSEFYTGWLDHWGEAHNRRDTKQVAESLDAMLKLNANVNMYMFIGGTNFGFWNGANGGLTTRYQSQPTSYDYDAPLTEAGDPWEKYMAIRDVIKKYNPVPDHIPPATQKTAYGQIQADQYNTLSNSPNLINRSDGGDNPICMEVLTQAYGFINYTKVFQPSPGKTSGKLTISGLHDRAVVYIGNMKQGILERTEGKDEDLSLDLTLPSNVPATGVSLSIIVENMGRINFGAIINDSKGILGTVSLDGAPLTKDWLSQAIPLNNTEFYPLFIPIDKTKTNTLPDSTAFYHFSFSVDGTANDTFLNVDNWTKGIAIVNNFNIGRYWPARGPQKTLYVPASVLKSNADNKIVLFEIDNAPCSSDFSKCIITLTDKPNIG